MVKTHVWEVTIAAPPLIVITPNTAHNFGNVAWKSDGSKCSSDFTYMISNAGGTAALITITTPSVGGDFTCTLGGGHTCGVAFSLAPGVTTSAFPNFCPKSAGAKTGVLRVACSNCTTQNTEVSLTGTGINTTIGVINESASTYSAGPYQAGAQDVNIASVSITNTGNTAGTLQYRCYIYANETGESMLLDGTTTNNYNPGASVQQPQIVDVPSGIPSGSVTFGVKVKGQTETTWPAWGALGTMIWTEGLDIDTGMIIGGVAAASIIGGLLYIAFKKR